MAEDDTIYEPPCEETAVEEVKAEEEASEEPVRRRRRIWPWVVLGILVLLALTNPSKQSHVDDICQTAMEKAQTRRDGSPENTVVLTLGSALMHAYLDVNLKYHNYILFSTTTLQGERKKGTMTFGILGMVIEVGE